MHLLSIVIFAFALSFDGFGVGLAYGVRKIKIPLFSLLVISCTSAVSIGISMLGGHVLSNFISTKWAERIGAAILIGVGIWIVFQTCFQHRQEKVPLQNNLEKDDANLKNLVETQLLKIHIKPLGLVIQILREPVKADLDKSGIINSKEALLLGFALAMDALGAGFGAAMAGYKPLMTPLIVGIVKFVMVGTGDYIGKRFTAQWLGEKISVLPGWFLIILGVAKVYMTKI